MSLARANTAFELVQILHKHKAVNNQAHPKQIGIRSGWINLMDSIANLNTILYPVFT